MGKTFGGNRLIGDSDKNAACGFQIKIILMQKQSVKVISGVPGDYPFDLEVFEIISTTSK